MKILEQEVFLGQKTITVMISYDNINNSIFLKNLYPNGLDLKGEVSEVTFLNEGPSIQVSFHLEQMPLVKPKKWAIESNRILLVLEFIEIKELNFIKWGRKNTINLKHEKQEQFHCVSIKGTDCNLSFKSKWICFKSLSPYYNS